MDQEYQVGQTITRDDDVRLARRRAAKTIVATIPTEIVEATDRPRGPQTRVVVELLLIVVILLIAGIAHGSNMFRFPYLEDDEGVYTSQAWAVVNLHQLAPYTYWYDHSPVGWFQLALWSLLTGGFSVLGFTIYSMRVLMLVYQLASTWMVYRITRRVSGTITAGAIAALLFAVSPLGIYFHRRVLLDNITVLWLLISISLLVGTKTLTLRRIWLSAIAFGIAVLSKENTVVLLPALPLIVYYRAHKVHRGLAVFGWMVVAVSTVSFYILFALLNGELFPMGFLPWDHAQHVSLLGSLQYQSGRGKDGGLLDWNSHFWVAFRSWIYGAHSDPVLILAGSICALISIPLFRVNRIMAILGATTLLGYFFLARGGVTYDFYIVPQLPLLAINVGLVIGIIVNRVKGAAVRRRAKPRTQWLWQAAATLGLVALITVPTTVMALQLGFPTKQIADLYQNHEVDGQIDAYYWILNNVPNQSTIVFDNYLYTDLRIANRGYVELWYWKVDFDPAIRDTLLHGDWNNVDYFVVTPQVLHDMGPTAMPLLQQIYDHSIVIQTFDTGGWPVEIRQVVHRDNTHPAALTAPPGGALGTLTAPPGQRLTLSLPVAIHRLLDMPLLAAKEP